ncbi:uncharacterized protein LOC122380927 isoform X2 [Amphibalanus amphitrite]|nr:uncharacterized protein LOC122380927 isoform X2 [Amphibalanus amphitrite]XP_043220499.1 uncharacterized protein LOC122380927 isoform X2 [Amphibalanus amphitrite]
MDKTFADRRQLVIKRKIGLAALKRVYPALFNEVEIWEELARVRGVNRTWEEELEEARMALKSMLNEVAFCDTLDEKLAHVLMEMREEHVVFGPPGGRAGPPTIHEEELWVEGVKVAQFERFMSKPDQYLTWGAAFTVFAQRLSFRATQAAAYWAGRAYAAPAVRLSAPASGI